MKGRQGRRVGWAEGHKHTHTQRGGEYTGKQKQKWEGGIYLQPREHFSVLVWIFWVSIPYSNVKSGRVPHEGLNLMAKMSWLHFVCPAPPHPHTHTRSEIGHLLGISWLLLVGNNILKIHYGC